MTPLCFVSLQPCRVWTIDLPELIPVISEVAGAQAGEAADLFHRGRDEVGQQGHCDTRKNFHAVVTVMVGVRVFVYVYRGEKQQSRVTKVL